MAQRVQEKLRGDPIEALRTDLRLVGRAADALPGRLRIALLHSLHPAAAAA